MTETQEESKLNESLKLIVKSSILVFILLIVSKILSYVYRIVVARYFGPEVYGLFSLSIMILGWFVAFSSLGLYEGILRYIAIYRGKKEPEKIRYLFKFSLTIGVITSIIAGVLLFFLAKPISINIFHNPGLVIFLQIFSIVVPFFLLANILLSVVQAFERIKAYTIILDFVQHFIKVLVLILLIIIGFNSNSVIISYGLGIFAIFLASYLYCKYKLPDLFAKYSLKKEVKSKITRELFSYSWPILFMSIVYSIFPWIDFIAIGYFKGATQVGFYDAAIPIAQLLVFLPPLFLRLFFPMATKQFFKKNLDLVKELSKQTEKWIFIINLPLFLLMVLFPGAIINILFGSEYLVAETSLRYAAAGFFFFSISLLFYNLLAIVGKSKLILINLLITSVLNIILNILLVPKYGITGAAISTMISYIALFVIFFLQTAHYTSIIPFKRRMIQVLISVGISTIVLFFVKQVIPTNLFTIILQIILFLLLYLMLIFLTRSLDKNDIMIIKSIHQKITGKKK